MESMRLPRSHVCHLLSNSWANLAFQRNKWYSRKMFLKIKTHDIFDAVVYLFLHKVHEPYMHTYSHSTLLNLLEIPIFHIHVVSPITHVLEIKYKHHTLCVVRVYERKRMDLVFVLETCYFLDYYCLHISDSSIHNKWHLTVNDMVMFLWMCR